MFMKTVAIIIINDEILQDKKVDHISSYLIKELNLLQYNVSKITVIPEQERVIRCELEVIVKTCDIIIVVGGVKSGNIYRAIGEMTSQKLQCSKELKQILNKAPEAYVEDEILIPIYAKLLSSNDIYPVIYLQRMFVIKEDHLKTSFTKILKNHLIQYRQEHWIHTNNKITQNGNTSKDLNERNQQTINNVKLEMNNGHCFELKISHELTEMDQKITNKFTSYKLHCEDHSYAWEKIYASEDEKHVRKSLEIIEECLKLYQPGNFFVSFNGGKDCTVLLHLVLAVLKKKYPHHTHPLFCLYVQSENSFPEQDAFIAQCEEYYNLQMMTIKSGIKEALEQILAKFPDYKACFMGTRSTDPFSSELSAFQMTDSSWPQIMRVNPLLEWRHCDIWDFLLFYKIPYCKLYDMGFTSLGNQNNTIKNPSLIYYDPAEAKEIYLPAYKLLKEADERNGRNSS